MGKLKTHLGDQELLHDLFLMCLTQSKLTVEGSGNADHDGNSSMICLMNMLGIAMNFKKRNLIQKKPRIYFNWRGFLDA